MKTKKDDREKMETEGLGLGRAAADDQRAGVPPAGDESYETLGRYDPRPERVFTVGLALLAGGFTDWPNLRSQAEACVDALAAESADDATTISPDDAEYLSTIGTKKEHELPRPGEPGSNTNALAPTTETKAAQPG